MAGPHGAARSGAGMPGMSRRTGRTAGARSQRSCSALSRVLCASAVLLPPPRDRSSVASVRGERERVVDRDALLALDRLGGSHDGRVPGELLADAHADPATDALVVAD